MSKNKALLIVEATPVPLGDVDDYGDCQDEGIPMQRLVHDSSLHLQLSLNYLYCLIRSMMWSQHFLRPVLIPSTYQFCTNRPSLVVNCHPLSGISDHEAVLISSISAIKLNPPTKRKIYLWSKADFSSIQQVASNLCANFIHTYSRSTPVNVLWDAIKVICKRCLDMVPNKESSTRYNQPWVNNTIKRLSQKKQRCYNQAHITGLEADWQNTIRLKESVSMSVRKLSIITSLTLLVLIVILLLRSCGHILKAKNEITAALAHYMMGAIPLLTPKIWQTSSIHFLPQYSLTSVKKPSYQI